MQGKTLLWTFMKIESREVSKAIHVKSYENSEGREGDC
jgi:hypothetical protein